MAGDLHSPTGILDEAPGAVKRIAAPWLGVLWLTELPLRFFQVHFFRELSELGDDVNRYGDYLGQAALIVLLAFIPALFGRAVFVRACFLGLQSGKGVGPEALRVPPGPFLNYLYAALLCEALFFVFLATWITIPFFILLTGLAAVTWPRTGRPSLLTPLREIAAFLGNLKIHLTLLFAFGVGLVVAFVNIYFLFQAGLWALGASGSELSFWEYVLRQHIFLPIPQERLPRYVCIAGAFMAVEPFWLAALAVHVHRARLSETGEDLRLAHERLRRGK